MKLVLLNSFLNTFRRCTEKGYFTVKQLSFVVSEYFSYKQGYAMSKIIRDSLGTDIEIYVEGTK